MATSPAKKTKWVRRSTKKSEDPTPVTVPAGKFILERMSANLHEIVDVQLLAFEELGAFICGGGWTATIFMGKRHKKSHFRQHSGVLALDFDAGLTLAEAKRRFDEYRHIIGLTKSHQKTKNPGTGSEKAACDRFRVLLFSERPADSIEELEATNKSLYSWNSEADKTCLHAAKVWSPCSEIVVQKAEGRLVAIGRPTAAISVPMRAGAGRANGRTGLSMALGPGTGIDYSPEQVPGPALPRTKVYQAASSFLRSTRPSVSGQNGHDRLFRAAATLVKEFMIDVDDAVDLIWKHFNPRCTNIDGSPHPWSMTDIKHKVRDAVRSTKHVYGHGVNKDWDVRWKCCPALASLVDRLERNEVVDWKLYAPGIEEHAQAAIKRRWVASKTTKKRVDRHWFSELEQFLQGCPHQELKADYILSTAFRIESPTNGQKTRLGRSMSAHGWSSKRTRVDGRLVQFYVAPGSSAR